MPLKRALVVVDKCCRLRMTAWTAAAKAAVVIDKSFIIILKKVSF